ncbi:hypothetical protein CHOTACABRAS_160 [Bacillus phage Chotacabras]|nr:hypothetical protein CHOTACABRAS_160 [Bacillus phage Chotacabras]
MVGKLLNMITSAGFTKIECDGIELIKVDFEDYEHKGIVFIYQLPYQKDYNFLVGFLDEYSGFKTSSRGVNSKKEVLQILLDVRENGFGKY